MARAFVFPGQGSQAVGMGKALAELFRGPRGLRRGRRRAGAEALAAHVRGPGEELTLTANAQPALMAVVLAVVRVLEPKPGSTSRRRFRRRPFARRIFGACRRRHAFRLADTARLLRIRGMPCRGGPGRRRRHGGDPRASNRGRRCEVAREAAQGEVCDVANDNGGGQIVVSRPEGGGRARRRDRARRGREARHPAAGLARRSTAR